MKAKLLLSISHCKDIDADFDRSGANVEEPLDPGTAEVPAAPEEDEDSDRHRANPFAEHGDEYSSEGMGGGGGGGEEEEEE